MNCPEIRLSLSLSFFNDVPKDTENYSQAYKLLCIHYQDNLLETMLPEWRKSFPLQRDARLPMHITINLKLTNFKIVLHLCFMRVTCQAVVYTVMEGTLCFYSAVINFILVMMKPSNNRET